MTREAQTVVLSGGWGYGNLGDEAILRGYIDVLPSLGYEPLILSVDPVRTSAAQGSLVNCRRESSKSLPAGTRVIVCGGGYLNGSWRFEASRRLHRYSRWAGTHRLGLHAVEISNMQHPWQRHMLKKVVRQSTTFVRDVNSQRTVHDAGGRAATIPDAIALSRARLRTVAYSSSQRVLLNAMDLMKRPDRAEAEFDVSRWRSHLHAIDAAYGDDLACLAIDDEDRRFLEATLPSRLVIQPQSVDDLIATIGASRALITTRMHPGLIASQLGTPVAMYAYCQKVRSVLRKLELERLIVRPDFLDRTHDPGRETAIMEFDARSASANWEHAYDDSLQALTHLLSE